MCITMISHGQRYFNNVTGGSTFRYGLYNSVSNSSATGGMNGIYNYAYGRSSMTGIRNYISQSSSATSGTVYGEQTYIYPRTSSAAYGNLVYAYRFGGNGATYGLRTYVYTTSSSSSTAYGLYSNIGSTGTGAKYGVYSSVPTTQSNWYAGYFNGDVHVTGSLTTSSDETKKQNINEIGNALDAVMELSGKTYDYVHGDEINLPTERQYGFLAQDIEEIFPDLVKVVENPGAASEKMVEEVVTEMDEDGNEIQVTREVPVPVDGESVTYKSVNYIGLIPILVEAMKEQQALIESQQAMIDELKEKVK